jgi:hypothetical protein
MNREAIEKLLNPLPNAPKICSEVLIEGGEK